MAAIEGQLNQDWPLDDCPQARETREGAFAKATSPAAVFSSANQQPNVRRLHDSFVEGAPAKMNPGPQELLVTHGASQNKYRRRTA